MADEQEPKKKSKLKWLVLVFILLLLGGGGYAAWHFYLADMLGKTEDGAATTTKVSGEAKVTGMKGTVVPLPVFRVNLADPLGKRFIKLMVEVEAANPDVAGELEAYQAPIRDAIILLLSSKSNADLATVEGKLVLKSEITDRINQILGGPKVLQVFFTDIVIQ